MATTYLPGAVRPANPMRAPNTLSRRMLLGGMVAAPTLLAVTSVTGSILPPRTEGGVFHQRLAAFEHANAKFLHICFTPGLPDEVGNEACEAAGEAYDAMIATPADDFAGLARKLDALARWSSGSDIPNDEIRMLGADARRLLGRED